MDTIPMAKTGNGESLPYTHRIKRGFFLWKKINGDTRFFSFTEWEEEHCHFYGEGYCDYYDWIPVSWVEKNIGGNSRLKSRFVFRKTIAGVTKFFTFVRWVEQYQLSNIRKFGNHGSWNPVKWDN